MARVIAVLDFIVVFVLRSWGVLANVLSFGKSGVEYFSLVPSVGLRETMLGR